MTGGVELAHLPSILVTKHFPVSRGFHPGVGALSEGSSQVLMLEHVALGLLLGDGWGLRDHVDHGFKLDGVLQQSVCPFSRSTSLFKLGLFEDLLSLSGSEQHSDSKCNFHIFKK